MKLNIRFQEEKENLSTVVESGDSIQVDFGSEVALGTKDYRALNHKPQINSVTIDGNVSLAELGLRGIYYDTKENWDSQLSLIAEEGAVYIYSNYQTIYDEVGNPTFIAGIKIGDGSAYLIDMPFVTDAMSSALLKHIGDMEVHVTAAEREFWNHKVSSFIDEGQDNETLILSKTLYEKDGTIIAG